MKMCGLFRTGTYIFL
uniref:Uncharacterized protein n=1 Tax=Rhizophora mucronata TaxID=61149 RepID=A0A2P2IXS6_RHIMU